MQATDARRRSSTAAAALFNAAASERMTTHSLLNTGGVAMKRKVGVDELWVVLAGFCFLFCGGASGDSSPLISPLRGRCVGESTLPILQNVRRAVLS